MSKYEDLEVWKASHQLVLDVYRIVGRLPQEEKFRLGDQLCRAVTSIPINISEGTGRKTRKDFAHFLYISRGSLQETKYLVTLLKDLGYIDPSELEAFTSQCSQIGRLLNGLINSIS